MTGRSFVPVMVTVTICVSELVPVPELSVAAIVYSSTSVSPAARKSKASLPLSKLQAIEPEVLAPSMTGFVPTDSIA